MITNETNIRNFQLIHDITLPQELVCDTKITEISTMDDEINVISFIEVIDKILGFIIPTL